jgi:uncharacterized membrane protein YfcA
MNTDFYSPLIPDRKVRSSHLRRILYPVLLGALLLTWTIYMTWTDQWGLFRTYWPMSLTMVYGSFIAGATPQGGAAVAFPVFTKLLKIPTGDARTFGLMIQSIGMSMATVMILVRRIPVLPRVIGWTTLGGIFGQILGTYVIIVPDPYPRVLFTLGAAAFGIALAVSRWAMSWQPINDLPRWGLKYQAAFLILGVFGGMGAAHTGSGADMLIFIVLTLAFGVDVKISTPTTVIIMGLNSLVGFALHGLVSQDIGISWNYWLVAAPVVAIGAPLGAIFAARVSPDVIITTVLSLITIEVITTLWLIPITKTIMLVTVLVVGLCAVCFIAMLVYRQRRVVNA